MRYAALIFAVTCLPLAGCDLGVQLTPPLPAALQPEFFPAEQGFLNDMADWDGIDRGLSDSDPVRVASRLRFAPRAIA